MLLAPLLLANSQEQTLCYNLKWTTPAGKELRKSFNAITSFPATHPKVTGRDQNGKFLKTCGTVPAFSAIPTTSSWPWQNRGYGSNWKSDDSCKTLSGAEVFYGYHAPYGSSANAGDRGYKAGALLAYFIIDDSLNSYLVLTADQPKRGGLDAHRANISLAGRLTFTDDLFGTLLLFTPEFSVGEHLELLPCEATLRTLVVFADLCQKKHFNGPARPADAAAMMETATLLFITQIKAYARAQPDLQRPTVPH